MLFQFGALFTDMSVFENVAFPMREHTDLPEELIRDLVLMKLQRGGLARRRAAHARRSFPAAWRGAWRSRARSRSTRCWCMYDEPFAGLDPISLGVVGQLIRQAQRRARHHLDRRHARRLRIAEDRRLPLFRLRGRDRRRRARPTRCARRATPFVRQFVDGEPDGPVPFHYPAPRLRDGAASPMPSDAA